MEILKLSEQERHDLYSQIHIKMGLEDVAVEKDMWVTTVLKALFALPYADKLYFKGGTSLSKCWNVIERFSEDIDIAVNRELLDFKEPMSKTQIKEKLRVKACEFVRTTLKEDIAKSLANSGVVENFIEINVPEITAEPLDSDTRKN